MLPFSPPITAAPELTECTVSKYYYSVGRSKYLTKQVVLKYLIFCRYVSMSQDHLQGQSQL
jgi:hypothetical protein